MFPEVYDQLRRVAHRYFRAGRPQVTLQPTGLVHEVYLRLSATTHGPPPWRDREHFCAIAARAMRQVLIDYCRRRLAAKRGGDAERISLSGVAGPGEGALVDLIALEAAMRRLGRLDARMAQVVELRAFGGMTGDDIAAELGVSRRTVDADWRRARAWLAGELGPGWQLD